jgi:hypothetical protein
LFCPRSPIGRGNRLKPGPVRVQPPPGVLASYNRLEMGHRSEEDPDEDPDEPDEPNHPADGAAVGAQMVPNVGLPSREWEFSTQVVTVAQLVDGVTLVKVLKKAGEDGWDLTDVIDGGDKRVLLMRRSKRSGRESRRVGFAPPKQN